MTITPYSHPDLFTAEEKECYEEGNCCWVISPALDKLISPQYCRYISGDGDFGFCRQHAPIYLTLRGKIEKANKQKENDMPEKTVRKIGDATDRAANAAAKFRPASETYTLPCLEVGGVQVYAYVENGVLRVSVDYSNGDVSTATPFDIGNDGGIPTVIDAGHDTVWESYATPELVANAAVTEQRDLLFQEAREHIERGNAETRRYAAELERIETLYGLRTGERE